MPLSSKWHSALSEGETGGSWLVCIPPNTAGARFADTKLNGAAVYRQQTEHTGKTNFFDSDGASTKPEGAYFFVFVQRHYFACAL